MYFHYCQYSTVKELSRKGNDYIPPQGSQDSTSSTSSTADKVSQCFIEKL